ncbi:aspartate carbamoyltransferase catalytic subunit [Maritimibacter sp. DP1N21-5]|uniref:aspartate carbamoyltransferase catalytic subunit n=1 Tax=Maritimibacter sp. DP1N21-5 TaxID=2836867 RepID=UPI001C4823ED|nr:aspartate carbamoyltransferase catalytic subunit [Maritimibacter sp. DP1N21-5]MBV7407624.1 aspartate carbamoyltransferase catalytic subunit [Maritimibacter sp. DP1N21-5]
MTDTPAGWEGILDDGETILWQGRPLQDFHIALSNVVTIAFGIFFAGFALFWMVGAASMGGGPFWMFGLIHFSVGVGIVFWSIFGSTYSRRNTWYTLTDRRAIVATDFLFKRRSLVSYPVQDALVEFKAGPPDDIIFGHETKRGSKGRTYTVPVGFFRLEDGHAVMRIVRKKIHKVRDYDDEIATDTPPPLPTETLQ